VPALSLTLLVPPPQAVANERSLTPLASAVALEAYRLAHDQARGALPGWETVQKIDPAARITVTVGRTSEPYLTVLNPYVPGLSVESRRTLIEWARTSPRTLSEAAAGTATLINAVELRSQGIFENGVKVAELDVVLRRFAAEDVLVITVPARRGGSPQAAALGAVGGFALAYATAIGIGLNAKCQPNCGPVIGLMVASVVGMPIAGGYAAYRATSHASERVIYRRLRISSRP
jgi:hypothetical protein